MKGQKAWPPAAAGSGSPRTVTARSGSSTQNGSRDEGPRGRPPVQHDCPQREAYVAAAGPGGNVASSTQSRAAPRVGSRSRSAASRGRRVRRLDRRLSHVQELSLEGSTPGIRSSVTIPFARRLTAANDREALVGTAMGEGAVWAIGDAADRRLWRIDPVRHRVTATVDLALSPRRRRRGRWRRLGDRRAGDRLVRIDPTTNGVEASIPVGRGAGDVAFGRGSVWVAGAIDHTVTRVDPVTNRVTASIPLDAAAQSVAAREKARSGWWAMRVSRCASLVGIALVLVAGCGGGENAPVRSASFPTAT